MKVHADLTIYSDVQDVFRSSDLGIILTFMHDHHLDIYKNMHAYEYW